MGIPSLHRSGIRSCMATLLIDGLEVEKLSDERARGDAMFPSDTSCISCIIHGPVPERDTVIDLLSIQFIIVSRDTRTAHLQVTSKFVFDLLVPTRVAL